MIAKASGSDKGPNGNRVHAKRPNFTMDNRPISVSSKGPNGNWIECEGGRGSMEPMRLSVKGDS